MTRTDKGIALGLLAVIACMVLAALPVLPTGGASSLLIPSPGATPVHVETSGGQP